MAYMIQGLSGEVLRPTPGVASERALPAEYAGAELPYFL